VSPLLVIFVTVFIDLIGFGIIIPLLPFYAEHFGASAFLVGLLSTSFSFAQFVFAPFWGWLSDRVGRRPVILAGLVGSALSYAMFALADSLPMLFVARTLAGVAGANIPTAQAYIADITTPQTRAKGMGLVGAAFGLGFIFGPAIGGFLSHWGYAAPAWFAAGLSLANFCAALVLLPESRPAHARTVSPSRRRFDAFREALQRPHLPWVLLLNFIAVTAFASFEATFALFSERRFGFTTVTIGYMFAWIGIVITIVQGGLVGRVVPKVGERRVIPVALLVISVSLACVPLAPSVLWLGVVVGVLAAGLGFNTPSMLSIISQLGSDRDQGSTLGLSQSLASLARIVGPAWGGFVFDALGMRSPFVTAAALMLVAAGIGVVVCRRIPATGSPDPELGRRRTEVDSGSALRLRK
jgi:MFS transporter, DHA1 family, tetracycline resistance protein